MTGYRITWANGTAIDGTTRLTQDEVMQRAHQLRLFTSELTRVDIWDADHYNAWPTADEQPTHS